MVLLILLEIKVYIMPLLKALISYEPEVSMLLFNLSLFPFEKVFIQRINRVGQEPTQPNC